MSVVIHSQRRGDKPPRIEQGDLVDVKGYGVGVVTYVRGDYSAASVMIFVPAQYLGTHDITCLKRFEAGDKLVLEQV